MSTISWTSTSGGDWSTPGNWQGGVVPGAADDVAMNITAAETITVSTAQAAHSVAMTDPAAVFVVANTGALDVTGNVTLTVDRIEVDGTIASGGSIAIAAGDTPADYGTIGPTGTIVTTDGTVTIVPAAASCFARGTRIDTATGPRPVETLAADDTVRLASGDTAPVTWVGHRLIDCRHHPDPRSVHPVRIRQGAFAENVPHRDLLLSPDHAVYVDDVLIPVRYLLNGRSIVQEACERVEYFHIELLRHDILLAEGLPVESYLDTGGRAAFENSSGVVQLHPSFGSAAWEAHGNAPLVVAGPALDRVARRLLARAQQLPVSDAEIARLASTA